MMPQQQWRMFGLGMAAVLGMCAAHIHPAGAQDEERPEVRPPRVKVQAGPSKRAGKPVKPKSADAAYEASKRAYEALPLADRKAVQEALVWVADYKGTLDGAFGKRTREALIAFEKKTPGLNSDAVIDRGELARLLAAARASKEAVGFAVVADKGAGIALGLPLKLVTRRVAVDGGTRFASADYGFVVETKRKPASDADLEALYEKLSADKDGRTVTYKAAREAWFVVSGETGKDGEKHFYSRFDRNPDEQAGGLRGYTVLYDGARSFEFDRLAIAVANSVEPFPSEARFAALRSAAPEPPTTADRTTEPKARATPPTAPPVALDVSRRRFTGTAVVVAPGKALGVLPDACTSPAAGKAALRIASRDGGSGLTVLDGVSGKPIGAAVRDPAPAQGDSMVVVGFTAANDGVPALGVASGEVTASAAGPRILAPLQDNAAGSAVFDRTGAFRGLVGALSTTPRRVAGIVPQASHPLLLADALTKSVPGETAAAASPGPDARKQMAGQIAAAAGDSLIAIDCIR